MQRAKTRTCSECGSAMRFGRFEDSVEYKDVRREITSKGWHCASCGEAILEAEALAASERAFIELRAEVDGLRRSLLADARTMVLEVKVGAMDYRVVGQAQAGDEWPSGLNDTIGWLREVAER